MIKKEDYALRISNASRLQLVIINFELIIDYLNEAKENRENEKVFSFNIQKSRDFLREMKLSLNMEYDISYKFLALYNYIERLIARFLFSKSDKTADEALELLNGLLNSWKQVKEDDSSPVMQNTQQMYAGLTYGRGGKLNEYVDIQVNRGFKV